MKKRKKKNKLLENVVKEIMREVLGMKNIKHEEQTRPNKNAKAPKTEKPGKSAKGGN